MSDNLIYNVQKKPGKIIADFSAVMTNIDLLAEEVKVFMNKIGLERYSFAVRVVMREGLTNAVRHGSKNNPCKLVSFELAIENNTIKMIIEDEGDGFDWKRIKKTDYFKEGRHIPLDHGRGFPIIEEYFDEYDYNEKGNIVTIIKKIFT